MRRLASILWMAALYVATLINEMFRVGPEDLLLFEAQQIIVHTVSYAVQAWLIASAVNAPATALIGLAVVIGLGQEVLQSLVRGFILPLGSLVDLIVDGAGAALGLWLLGLWRGRSRKFD
jgi:VanZ family protein